MVAERFFAGPLVPATSSWALAPRTPATESLGRRLTLLSWNLLAPPFKRLGGGKARESDTAGWLLRAQEQVRRVHEADADVIGLQEFWCANPTFVALWKDWASENGYTMFVSPRTGGKEDGLCMLVRGIAPAAESAAPHEPSGTTFDTWSYNDWGDRVVQSVALPVAGERLTLLQTHLTFPHPSAHDGPMRRAQAQKLAEHVRALRSPATVCFGDLNGGSDDPAVSLLRRRGGLRDLPARGEGGWVSHKAHNGAAMACDFVLTAGRCRVDEWSLSDTVEGLLSDALLSDHRALRATLELGATPESDAEEAAVAADERRDAAAEEHIAMV